MRETKWHIKTTQRVSGRVLWNSGWRRSVCSTKLVYLGCSHVVCAYFALVCSSKLEHMFFDTAGYDLTWYTLASNLREKQHTRLNWPWQTSSALKVFLHTLNQSLLPWLNSNLFLPKLLCLGHDPVSGSARCIYPIEWAVVFSTHFKVEKIFG